MQADGKPLMERRCAHAAKLPSASQFPSTDGATKQFYNSVLHTCHTLTMHCVKVVFFIGELSRSSRD